MDTAPGISLGRTNDSKKIVPKLDQGCSVRGERKLGSYPELAKSGYWKLVVVLDWWHKSVARLYLLLGLGMVNLRIVPKKPVQEPIDPVEFRKVARAFAYRTGGDRVAQFKYIADGLVPGWFEWHSWTERIVSSLTKHRWTGILGCANSQKTRNVAGFAAIWWLTDPANSSVIFCSTTMRQLRRRGWAEIQNIANAVGSDWGNLVDSRTTYQFARGDDKHAIFGKAVAEGDVNKATADIQGVHTKRQMIVIDEAEAVPAAIWKAAANLYSYPVDSGGEFILVAIANPRSRLSQFGRFIEPDLGWTSINMDTEEWLSKPQLDGKRASVLRFDFTKSPNIIEGKTISRHIPTKHRVESRLAALKARGGESDPEHFCYDRAFPVPEGLLKTVFTETMLERFRAYDKHRFTGSNFLIIGVIDPAYGGGDRPVIRFAALGDIAGGKMGLEWCGDPLICFLDSTSPLPARYQLVSQIKTACEGVQYRGKTYQCLPKNFGIDTTGDAGLADIANMEWSTEIIRICFSEKPSDEPCSATDERPASEVYANKRAEMYWRTANGIISEQIKGLDKDTCSELVTIQELIEKADGTVRAKKTLQSKKEYKAHFTKSPDLADAGCMLTEVARMRGFSIAAIGLATQRNTELLAIVEKSQSLYHEDSFYQPDNEDFMALD